MEGIFESLKTWIMETISRAVDTLVQMKIDEQNAVLLQRKEVAEFLRMSADSFDTNYRYNTDIGFPKELPGCRWSKAAIIRWINEQK